MRGRKAELEALAARCALLEKELAAEKARQRSLRQPRTAGTQPAPHAPPVLPKGRAVYRGCRAATLEEAAQIARGYFSGCGPIDY